MRTGGERITTGTWNWGDRASTYLGPKQKNPRSLYDVIEPLPTPFPLPLIVSANCKQYSVDGNYLVFKCTRGPDVSCSNHKITMHGYIEMDLLEIDSVEMSRFRHMP